MEQIRQGQREKSTRDTRIGRIQGGYQKRTKYNSGKDAEVGNEEVRSEDITVVGKDGFDGKKWLMVRAGSCVDNGTDAMRRKRIDGVMRLTSGLSEYGA